jgi:hypothetical protein
MRLGRDQRRDYSGVGSALRLLVTLETDQTDHPPPIEFRDVKTQTRSTEEERRMQREHRGFPAPY